MGVHPRYAGGRRDGLLDRRAAGRSGRRLVGQRYVGQGQSRRRQRDRRSAQGDVSHHGTDFHSRRDFQRRRVHGHARSADADGSGGGTEGKHRGPDHGSSRGIGGHGPGRDPPARPRRDRCPGGIPPGPDDAGRKDRAVGPDPRRRRADRPWRTTDRTPGPDPGRKGRFAAGYVVPPARVRAAEGRGGRESPVDPAALYVRRDPWLQDDLSHPPGHRLQLGHGHHHPGRPDGGPGMRRFGHRRHLRADVGPGPRPPLGAGDGEPRRRRVPGGVCSGGVRRGIPGGRLA